MANYPEREPFFANKFIRLMVKCCVANEIGTQAFALLTTIAMTEDATHYRRGVTYFDGQLMPIIGVKSKKAMTLIRKKAVEEGWLHYQPGHKGKSSTYWVCIPSHAEQLDDFPTDEGFDNGLDKGVITHSTPIRCQIGTAKGTNEEPQKEKCGTAKVMKGGLFIPVPVPVPVNEIAAELSQLFHFHLPGTSKPLLPDLTAEFQAKLDWLHAHGRNETEHIRKCIVDPKRDKTASNTIGKMWQFWKYCGLEEGNERTTKAGRNGTPTTAPGGGRYEGLQAPTI